MAASIVRQQSESTKRRHEPMRTYRPRPVAELLGPTRHLGKGFNRFMSGLSKSE
jgi:hypothetical protein